MPTPSRGHGTRATFLISQTDIEYYNFVQHYEKQPSSFVQLHHVQKHFGVGVVGDYLRRDVLFVLFVVAG